MMTNPLSFYTATDHHGNVVLAIVRGHLNLDLVDDIQQLSQTDENKQAVKEALTKITNQL